MYSRNGFPSNSNMHLVMAVVKGLNLVPRPPQRINICMCSGLIPPQNYTLISDVVDWRKVMALLRLKFTINTNPLVIAAPSTYQSPISSTEMYTPRVLNASPLTAIIKNFTICLPCFVSLL